MRLSLTADTQWTLEEFAIVANDLLPQVLPGVKTNAKLSEEITPRLIRYYVNQGVLDEPIREGKYAFYNHRHLLQILLSRRLLAEGFTVAVIASIASHKTNTELEAMLTGGMEFHLTPAQSPVPLAPTPAPTQPHQWLHIPLREGIELHWRSDVPLPQTPLEDEQLLLEVKQALQALRVNRDE